MGSISIHAPRKGSDRYPGSSKNGKTDFNPRSPQGERRHQVHCSLYPQRFQSTLPARGATCGDAGEVHRVQISIHAPRKGSDAYSRLDAQKRQYFNPRSPQGERRYNRVCVGLINSISIHAPRKGSDNLCGAAGMLDFISIHAPRKGSDHGLPAPFAPVHNFNPRSPQGERPLQFPRRILGACISIHAPRKGSDAIT